MPNPDLKSRYFALLCGCFAALTWGLTGTFIKLLPTFSTVEILTVRLVVALGAMIPLLTLRRSAWPELVKFVRQPIGLLLSSLMVFYYLFAVRAFQLAPVSDVVLIVGLSPLMGLAAKAIARKPVAFLETIGALTAFVGLLLFISPKLQGNASDRTSYLTGLGFALLAACVTLGYAMLVKYYSTQRAVLNPGIVSCATFALGTCVLLPTSMIISPAWVTKLAQPRLLLIGVSLGIISTVIPTLCYSIAAKQLSPVATTALNLLTPVFAAAIAFLLLRETLPLISLIGAALILGGIMTLSLSTSQPTKRATS